MSHPQVRACFFFERSPSAVPPGAWCCLSRCLSAACLLGHTKLPIPLARSYPSSPCTRPWPSCFCPPCRSRLLGVRRYSSSLSARVDLLGITSLLPAGVLCSVQFLRSNDATVDVTSLEPSPSLTSFFRISSKASLILLRSVFHRCTPLMTTTSRTRSMRALSAHSRHSSPHDRAFKFFSCSTHTSLVRVYGRAWLHSIFKSILINGRQM